MMPRLSILVPFYRDDPSPLLRSLDVQIGRTSDVEIRIMDDGTGDAALTQAVETSVASMNMPTILTTSPINRGRSATRNALQDQARAEWVLFLDADMRVDHADFIERYLQYIEADDSDIIFGGFTVEDHSSDPDTDLHRLLSQSSDCLDVETRGRAGAQFVASSNLCVRKNVLIEQPFDPDFVGWGWEDSEWAARVGEAYRLHHIDNPAVHLGLETTETLLSRFANSGPNYRRFVERHPVLAQTLPLFRIVSRLKSVPGHTLARYPLRSAVRMRALPGKFRILALKLWRASHYAEAMR